MDSLWTRNINVEKIAKLSDFNCDLVGEQYLNHLVARGAEQKTTEDDGRSCIETLGSTKEDHGPTARKII